jgi:hypothetical protein
LGLTGAVGVDFWDAGAVAIIAPAEDLAAGRYDRLVSNPSMG